MRGSVFSVHPEWRKARIEGLNGWNDFLKQAEWRKKSRGAAVRREITK
jgi:hypothetical protein